MATIKSYTDLSQSKVLAEILPLESADMYYEDDISVEFGHWWHPQHIPCWSLAALLSVLPEYYLQRTDWYYKIEYKIVVYKNEDNYTSKNYDNPVDACVELILKLHELKML